MLHPRLCSAEKDDQNASSQTLRDETRSCQHSLPEKVLPADCQELVCIPFISYTNFGCNAEPCTWHLENCPVHLPFSISKLEHSVRVQLPKKVTHCCCVTVRGSCVFSPPLHFQWQEKELHYWLIYSCSCNSPTRQSSKLSEIWWQAENVKQRTVSQEKVVLVRLDRGAWILSETALSLLPFISSIFFLVTPPFLYCLRDLDWTEQAFRGRVKEEEQAWLDGHWTKCVLDRKVTGNKRSPESWDRGIATAWEQPKCFTDMSGQTFKATR